MYPPVVTHSSVTATSFVPSADDATDRQNCVPLLLPAVSAVPEFPVVPPMLGPPLPPLLHPPGPGTTNTDSTTNFTRTEDRRFDMGSPIGVALPLRFSLLSKRSVLTTI